MNDQFIPLVPPHSAAESAVLGQTLQPLQALGSTTHPAHPANSPKITLKRDGDRITHINVVCSCGQVVELACVY